MGRTCGEPNEIKKGARLTNITALFQITYSARRNRRAPLSTIAETGQSAQNAPHSLSIYPFLHGGEGYYGAMGDQRSSLPARVGHRCLPLLKSEWTHLVPFYVLYTIYLHGGEG